MGTKYFINEPRLYVGEITVENQLELIPFKIEFYERFGRDPEIKKMKEVE